MLLSRGVFLCTLLALIHESGFAAAETTIPVLDLRTGRITGSTADVLPSAAVNPTPTPAPVTANLNRRILSATVRLSADGSEGTAYGSGTLVAHNGKEALIVTCGHIFRGTSGETVRVTLFTSGAERHLEGRVLSFDLDSDVGIVSVSGVGAVTTIPIAEPEYAIQVRGTVIAAGCDRGGSPNAESTTIKHVNLYHGPENITVAATPPHGRSGGGLVTPDRMLIGVCNGIDTVTQDGIYASLACIHRELAKTPQARRLHHNARQATAAIRSNVTNVSTPAQHLAQRSTPDGQIVEVICVIKSDGASDGTRVIRLRNLSPGLLNAMRDELRDQPKIR